MEFVKVDTLGSERKKYKVVAGISHNMMINQGNWSFTLPPLQDMNNSTHYNQCLIKITKICINPYAEQGQVPVQDNLQPTWYFTGGLYGYNMSAVLMHFSIPCPQSATLRTDIQALNGGDGIGPAVLTGDPYITDHNYRLSELVPCTWVLRGNHGGEFVSESAMAPVGADAFTNSYGIVYRNYNEDGYLCGNPFGQRIDIRISDPRGAAGRSGGTVGANDKLYLSNDEPALADGNGIPAQTPGAAKDITEITIEMEITMIENN